MQGAIAAADNLSLMDAFSTKGGQEIERAGDLAVAYCRTAGWRPTESELPEGEQAVLGWHGKDGYSLCFRGPTGDWWQAETYRSLTPPKFWQLIEPPTGR